ncbi:hydrolase [Photobacterium sp. BZF1]|uniref:hydrolase n=1 Tax=Photobacterium TaxID=657 RepID=UPI0016537EFB|nr:MULTISPECIES: hydrolase [Photobacterium]MBC7001532.1 hydrolase [Photobacterium sp. BZF1]MBY5948318.1 hydrolase [Photobacterium rosenbergii]
MLTTNDTALVIVDVQGKLAQIMDNKETLFKSLETVVKGAKILDIPIIWVEQIPHKLGPTIPQISDHLHDHSPIAKNSFSCYREPKFVDALAASGCKNVVVVGIEAHICVYQTVRQLLEADYHVEVVADAVSSRNPTNKQVALQKMQQFGASLTTAEMLIFELQEVAEGERFREILSVVK